MTNPAVFLILMVVGTFFLGIYDVLTRKILKTEIKEGILLGVTLTLSGLFSLAVSAIHGFPEIKPDFWRAFAVTVSLNIFAQLIWYKAFKREEASLISPLRLLTPPIVLLTGLMVLKEQPSLWGVIGVLTTIFGLWFLVRSEAHFKQVNFFEVMKKPGVVFGLIGAISFAVSFPFDKQAVINSSTIFFAGLAYSVIGFVNLLISYCQNRKSGFFGQILSIRKDLPLFVFVHIVGGLLTFEALNYALAAYAASAKRLWSLWTVLLSGHLLEEKNIGKKLLATFIMLGGIALTVFLG